MFNNSGPLKENVQNAHQVRSALRLEDESPEDEICNSLKMFALRAAYSFEEDIETGRPQSRDSIMGEFFKNGFSADVEVKKKNCTQTVSHVLQEKGQLEKHEIVEPYKHAKIINNKREKSVLSNKSCVFCKNNDEPYEVVKSHAVRDSKNRVLCPKLRSYVCPICKASGDNAHTLKYCPKKPIVTMEDSVRTESYRLAKAKYFKPGMKI